MREGEGREITGERKEGMEDWGGNGRENRGKLFTPILIIPMHFQKVFTKLQDAILARSLARGMTSSKTGAGSTGAIKGLISLNTTHSLFLNEVYIGKCSR